MYFSTLLRTIVASLLFGVALSLPAHAANLLFSLSSPTNLNTLTVGQSFNVDVTLSNLAAGKELVSLTGGVDFSPALLGSPTGMSSGGIVPNPLGNPLDFQTVGAAGQADAAFLTTSANPLHRIVGNGVFYSFTLTAQATGAGQIGFDVPSLIGEQFDSQSLQLPILRFVDAGPALLFNIVPAPTGGGGGLGAVPLPLALPGGLVLMGVAFTRNHRQRSRRVSAPNSAQ